MKKKMIALAATSLASLSGAAFADTNVTVYGIIDGTFDVINVSGGTATPLVPAKGTPRFNRVTSNGSRLGFKGTEELGNGMSAFFQFESNAKFDAGGGLDTGRDSFVGLKGGFGTVKLGNFSGPNRDLAGKLDVVIHSDGIGENSAIFGKLGGFGSYFDTRYTNSIAYITPKFSGLEGTLHYQANENKDETPGAGINTSLYEIGLKYDNGPVFIGFAHGKLREKNDAGNIDPSTSLAYKPKFGMGTDSEVTETRLGGMYKFDVASVRLMYGRTKAEGSLGELKQNVWGIGGTYNVTANGKLLAQYYSADDLSGNHTAKPADLSETGAKFWVLGYEHSLSKRTTLIAHYAQMKNDSRTSTVAGAGKGYDFGDGKTGFTGNNVKLSGIQLGVNHAF
ncbi:MAG: porin [Rugosibacter sp.]|nr:porin [Rugosibacter sp.]